MVLSMFFGGAQGAKIFYFLLGFVLQMGLIFRIIRIVRDIRERLKNAPEMA